jgi:hypothetical protein
MGSLEEKFEELIVDNYQRIEMGIVDRVFVFEYVDYKELENVRSRVLMEWCRFCENNGVGRYRRGDFSGIVLSDPCDSDFVLVMSRDDVLKLLAFGVV